MSCEQFEDALMDLAADGREPVGDLHAHVGGCPVCRSLFVREQLLFASIDSCVRQMANPEVPGSLLASLPTRLAQETSPIARRAGLANWFYIAAATAAALLLLAWLPFLRPRHRYGEVDVQQGGWPAPAKQEWASERPPVKSPSMLPGRKVESARAVKPTANHEPEVLVPPEEREAFARFVSRVEEHPDLGLAFADSAPSGAAVSLEIAPLQIAELAVRPLEEKPLPSAAER
jgi:hypothetical protein